MLVTAFFFAAATAKAGFFWTSIEFIAFFRVAIKFASCAATCDFYETPILDMA
jgi:hypothetical protein